MRIEISAPDNLSEIKLRQYQTFSKLEEPTDKDIIRIFLSLPDSVVDKIPYRDVERVSGIINDLFSQEPVFKKRFRMDGVDYGFIPNLDDMTFGEYNDLVSYSNGFDNMHKAMAVMYRPIVQTRKGQYLIEDYDGSHKYSEKMKEAPLDVVLGALVFFFDLANELMKAIPNYLRSNLTEEQRMRFSSENGECIINLELLLTEWEYLLNRPQSATSTSA